MEIQFFGANCIAVATKSVRAVIDDNLVDLGGKSIAREGDVVMFTHEHAPLSIAPRLLIDMPGEYEVSDLSIFGVQTRSHLDDEKSKTAVMYKVCTADVRALITGHIHPDLTDKMLEEIGAIDVLIVPVGGNGYTLDATGAMQVAKKVEPKMIIPTHYDSKSLSFPVPQQDIEQALKTLGSEPARHGSKLKIKPADFTENMQVIILDLNA